MTVPRRADFWLQVRRWCRYSRHTQQTRQIEISECDAWLQPSRHRLVTALLTSRAHSYAWLLQWIEQDSLGSLLWLLLCVKVQTPAGSQTTSVQPWVKSIGKQENCTFLAGASLANPFFLYVGWECLVASMENKGKTIWHNKYFFFWFCLKPPLNWE